MDVAPFAGAWIEMMLSSYTIKVFSVAPFAGAWIEICIRITNCKGCNVAPFAGAWIEIHIGAFNQMQPMSLPSRERGLKSVFTLQVSYSVRRSLRGSVD